MNGGHKVIKYIALAFAASIIFSVISFGYYFINAIANGVINNAKVSSEILKLEKDTNNKVLDIRAKVAKVKIVTGDELNATTTSKYVTIKKKGNVLIVKEKKHSVLKEHGEIVVTVPNDMEFDAVSIISGVGKVTAIPLSTNILEISAGVGKVNFDGLYVAKKANIEAGVGDFNVKNGILNNTNLELGVGSVSITAALMGKTSIEAGVGSVDLELIGSKEEYKITAEKGVGSINIDGKSISDDEIYGKGTNKISLEGGVGSIDVKFKKVR